MLTTDLYSVLGEHRAGHSLKQFPATAQHRADDFLAEVLRKQTFVSEQIPRLLGPGSGSGSDLAGLLANGAHIVRSLRFSDHQLMRLVDQDRRILIDDVKKPFRSGAVLCRPVHLRTGIHHHVMAFGPGAVLDHLPPDILMNCRNQNCPRLVMPDRCAIHDIWRSEEHTSELQSLMRISYAVFCL